MCSIFRGGSCFGTVPSFEMALVYMCSILHGGSCFRTVPSFVMAFVDLRRDKSFLFQKRLPSPKLLFLRGFIVLKWRSLWEEGCNIVRKRLPPPLQSCSKDFGSLYFFLAEVFLACLLCTLIFSRRFLGFDSCFESTAPWLSWCMAYTLVFGRRFLGFDSCFESTAPWLSYCVVDTLISGRRFIGFDL